jgi:hypothetical protein
MLQFGHDLTYLYGHRLFEFMFMCALFSPLQTTGLPYNTLCSYHTHSHTHTSALVFSTGWANTSLA